MRAVPTQNWMTKARVGCIVGHPQCGQDFALSLIFPSHSLQAIIAITCLPFHNLLGKVTMPIANTVEANIVVSFEDRFSGPACKAFEQFRKCAEAALKVMMNQVGRIFGTNLDCT